MVLTSARNPFLQAIRRAAAGGRPTEDGLIVAEGPHLVEEALRGKWRIERLLATAEGRSRYEALLQAADAEIVEISARAFLATASTETPQHVMALLRPYSWTWEQMITAPALVVAMDGVQDPGNAGTMVRSAEAFGATGIVLLKGCARVANGKFLRASAGSIFRVAYLESVDPTELIERTRSSGLKLYALAASGRITVGAADFRAPSALVVGSEAHGVSAQIVVAADIVSIPARKVESLNAAVACSIALFAAQEQRRTL